LSHGRPYLRVRHQGVIMLRLVRFCTHRKPRNARQCYKSCGLKILVSTVRFCPEPLTKNGLAFARPFCFCTGRNRTVLLFLHPHAQTRLRAKNVHRTFSLRLALPRTTYLKRPRFREAVLFLYWAVSNRLVISPPSRASPRRTRLRAKNVHRTFSLRLALPRTTY
jgi:hypothetical protein